MENAILRPEAIEAAARKDAELCGRSYVGLSRSEKDRFLNRAKAMLEAAASA